MNNPNCYMVFLLGYQSLEGGYGVWFELCFLLSLTGFLAYVSHVFGLLEPERNRLYLNILN